MPRKSWLSVPLMLGLSACVNSGARQQAGDGGGWDGGAARLPIDAGSACEIFVADPLIEHACFHAMVGPYRDRDFTKDSALLEINRAHTAFLLTLEPHGASYEATMRYDVQRAGGYAFFSSPEVQLRVTRPGEEQALPSFARHGTEICSRLPWVEAYPLAAGAHLVRVESPTPNATLVIEFMDEGALELSYRATCAPPTRPDAGEALAPDAGPLTGGSDGGHDGSLAAEDAGSDAGESCFVDPVLEHTCLHVTHSPAETVTASAGTAGASHVDTPHTFYVAQLPAEVSHLSYRPPETAEYVFYLGPSVDLALTAGGNMISATHDELVTGCDGLHRALVYQLRGTTKYGLTLHAEEGVTSTPLLLENVDGLAVGGWANRLEACE